MLDSSTPLRLENHPRPRTRREFLGQGFISGAAMIASPSLLGLFKGQEARAQAVQCNVSGAGNGNIPFVCFDLGGGANMVGSNVIVGGMGGATDFLSEAGYELQGLPPDQTPNLAGQIDTTLGLPFHVDSAFLRGIVDKASATTLANTNGALIAARSDNDTGNNPHNPMYGINRCGSGGSLVPLIGTENSESGGRSRAPMSMIDPAVRPTKVDRPSDATALVDTGKLVELLDQADAAAVMGAAEAISALKTAKMAEEQMVLDLIGCNYTETTDVVANFGNPTLLDPLADINIVGDATSIFTAAELNNNKFESTASVMKLVVGDFAGAGTIQFGGYDYHNGTRATGEIRDFEAGQAMGAVLEYAARMNQQVMVYVFTDGSLFSDGQVDNSQDGRGKFAWRGDNSGTSGVFYFVFDPTGRPQLTSPAQQQIGYYRMNGAVETGATPASNNVDLLAETICLNYLALQNRAGEFPALFPNHGLGANLDALISFAPIRNIV
jgi:hypothetical protein